MTVPFLWPKILLKQLKVLEESANEKVTSNNETSNELLVQNIINIFAVAIILTLRAFDNTFYVENFTSVIKHVCCI
jgi:hypothetical protein